MHKRAFQEESGDALTSSPTIPRVDIVVQNYLDSLLLDVTLDSDNQLLDEPHHATHPAPDTEEAKTEPVVCAQTLVEEFTEQLPVLHAVHPADVLAPDDTDAVQPEVARTEAVQAEAIQTSALENTEVRDLKSSAVINPGQLRIRPEWSGKSFASLLFDVNGLSLAAPLHALGGICPIEDKLQAVVGQADWFMGLLRWNDRNIRVVDTARYVMPERVTGSEHREGYHSVIILGDSNWALAVNSADQSVNFAPEDIRWRQAMGKRPWLAGTVLNNLRALLDIDVLLTMLNASEVKPVVQHQE